MNNNRWTQVVISAIPWFAGIIIGWGVSYVILQSQAQPTEFILTRDKDDQFSISIKLRDGKINFLEILDGALKKDRDKLINDLKLRGFHELNDDLIPTLQNKKEELLKTKIIGLLEIYERPFSKTNHYFRNIKSAKDMEEAIIHEIDYKSNVAKLLKNKARKYEGAFRETKEIIEIAIPDKDTVQDKIVAACVNNQFYGKTIWLSDLNEKSFYILHVSKNRSDFECRSGERIEQSLLVSKEVGRCLLGKEKFQARQKFTKAKAKIVADTVSIRVENNKSGQPDNCQREF